jgi:hypothetical protein
MQSPVCPVRCRPSDGDREFESGSPPAESLERTLRDVALGLSDLVRFDRRPRLQPPPTEGCRLCLVHRDDQECLAKVALREFLASLERYRDRGQLKQPILWRVTSAAKQIFFSPRRLRFICPQ